MDFSQISGYEFEDYVETLLKKMGFLVINKGYSNDGGIDLIAEYDKPIFKGKYIIQCKNWQTQVGQPPIRDLYGVTMSENANKGVLITTSNFTDQAREFAKGKNIELINGKELNQIAKEYGLDEVLVSSEAIRFYDAEDFDTDLYIYYKQKIDSEPSEPKYYLEIINFLHEYIVEKSHYTLKDADVLDEYIGWNQTCIKKCYSRKTKKNIISKAARNAAIAWALSLKGHLEEALELIADIGRYTFGSGRDMLGNAGDYNAYFNYLYNIMNGLGNKEGCNFISSFYSMESSKDGFDFYSEGLFGSNKKRQDGVQDYCIQKNVLAPKRFWVLQRKYRDVITMTTYMDKYLDIQKILENYADIENVNQGIYRFVRRHTQG